MRSNPQNKRPAGGSSRQRAYDRIAGAMRARTLSLRTGLKRMSRLTIAFSRCYRNHRAALSLWIGYYNFVRRHRSIRMAPAMAAGIIRRPWTMRDLMEAVAGY